MAFHVGQKVVCVNADFNAFPVRYRVSYDHLDGLTKGEIYTVRAVLPNGSVPWWDTDCISLHEIVRPNLVMADGSSGPEAMYAALRFLPLQEQGMSILRAILADPKVKIKETA